MAQLIDGRKWAAVSRAETAQSVAMLVQKGITPGLAVILVGDNPASESYVRGKEKAAREVGITSQLIRLPVETTETELLHWIDLLNRDPLCHGILVQLPLPDHIAAERVIEAISPAKDVDGFHTQNIGALSVGLPAIVPCTPLGVMKLLAYESVPIAGAHAVIIGRSNIVGKPMASLLLAQSATVTICHSKTHDLASITRQADILVAAVGRPKMVTGDMIKPGAVVIDVGINRTDEGLVGDVDFASASTVAAAITPVPRGVGPMTIAMLLHNTVTAALRT
ncbi:MAG: bifunctional methylenetetrahydrofolate dehydrogenase/methenyltetrahydrofolate cyclohydrolase FolD [Firmicutes bacterium]|nr:bifunctional methylenetetrahydrofolate dehydrogenase/methenyltetrahydrofolate cyclohydrolase FolD [Bacillota bacterium]